MRISDWSSDVCSSDLLVRRLSAEGVIIVFISHRIPEIHDLCDTISILRNGQHVATDRTASVSNAEIVRLVIGRSLGSTFPPKPDATAKSAPAALTAKDLRVGDRKSTRLNSSH